jgi:hypothetical protein
MSDKAKTITVIGPDGKPVQVSGSIKLLDSKKASMSAMGQRRC